LQRRKKEKLAFSFLQSFLNFGLALALLKKANLFLALALQALFFS